MDKLKILEGNDVYLPDVDGVTNCMHNYCLNMSEYADITVVAPRNRKDYVDNVPYKVIRYKSIFLHALNSRYGFPLLDRKFLKKVDALDCDIIHTHSPFNVSKFAVKYAKKHGIPAVSTFHSNMRMIIKDISKSNFLTDLIVHHLGRRYNKFDEVFVCSSLVEEQARYYGYKGKITYLPFGTDLPRCTCVDELTDKFNSKFGVNKDELVFTYVGRIMKLKRVDFILKSLKIVKDAGVNFRFYIIGKGPATKKLKKLSSKLGFTDTEVCFTGFIPREDFPLYCARSNLLLFPSIYDNFGLVKVEAAAYETPGLFIKNSCAGYEVEDGVNGFLSEDTTESFAEKILQAVKDKDKLKEIGKNASRDLYITWKECADKVYKRLTEIVEERKKEKINDDKK